MLHPKLPTIQSSSVVSHWLIKSPLLQWNFWNLGEIILCVFLFFFLSFRSCAYTRSWKWNAKKICTNESSSQKTPLLNNASLVVQPLILHLLDITWRHHITFLHNLCPYSQQKRSWLETENWTGMTGDMFGSIGSGMCELTNQSRLGIFEVGFKETGDRLSHTAGIYGEAALNTEAC